ncbi:hypothetical protein PVAP13_7KG291600 [Panicum virgatum]|uniref:Uncharacterized protein n=1 Tax=Panicum virgatum TaxID=38727 RepID=A0A8T0QGQ7_PANVG|nr:hypothetical protein PVAP13_7KG291600 [Panicum virgatum]
MKNGVRGQKSQQLNKHPTDVTRIQLISVNRLRTTPRDDYYYLKHLWTFFGQLVC